MANVRVRNGSRGVTYQAQVRLAGHRPITKTFSNRKAAKDWARDTEAKLSKGQHADSEAIRRRLAEACDKYLKTHPDLSRDHTRVVGWWRDNHGSRSLAKITTPWLTEMRDELAAGTYMVGPKDNRVARKRKTGTVNRQLTYLLTVISYCVEIGWLSFAPKVKKFDEARRVRFLSDAELAALTKQLESCRERVMLPFVYCALSSGARAGELLRLEWDDVDLAKGLAIIHDSKNTEGRKLYFRGRALNYLRDYAKVRHLGSPGVFLLNSGAPLTQSKYGKLFREATDTANIKDFRFHDLRHTAASFLAMNGATLLEIQQVLGHRTPSMVSRYAHLTESHVESVVDRVMSHKLAAAAKE